MTNVAAHNKNITVRFIERWPAHPPRKSDPYNKVFEAAKKRLKALGAYKCAVNSNYHWGKLEAHHSLVEEAHALAGEIDLQKFNDLYKLSLASDDELMDYINSPGGLEILCELHHRGQEGVHSLPEPEWNVLRVAKDDQNIVSVISNNDVPVIKDKEIK